MLLKLLHKVFWLLPNIAHPARIKHEMRRTRKERISPESTCLIRKPFLLNQISFSGSLMHRDLKLRRVRACQKTQMGKQICKYCLWYLERGSFLQFFNITSLEKPSKMGPSIPMPPQRILWPHPWMSAISEWKTQFTELTGREFLFWHKMRESELCKN